VGQTPESTPERQRISDVLQPFLDLERRIQSRRRIPHYDAQSAILLLVTLGAFIPLGLGDHYHLPIWKYVGIGGMCIGGAGLLWSLATDVSRFIRRQVYPRLVKGLVPLKPSYQELKESLWACRKQEFMTAHVVELNKLIVALEAAGCSPLDTRDPHG